MTDTERREAARQFFYKWQNKGKEDEDDRSYWIDFLQDIMGVSRVTDRIEFQKKVVGPDGNTKRIDAYIPETRVLIEQKSLGIDLSKPQAGHNGMTPYEQAKMYDNSLPVSEKSKWIIVSNFAEIWIYDMDARIPEPTKIELSEIPTKYSLFEFLVNKEQQKLSHEMEVSVKAGEFVGLLYDALHKEYINPDSEESLRSLNMLCVRLVFCLYAEDALIFGENGHMFHDYMADFETSKMRKALIDLFKILDTPEDKRDPYDKSLLSEFPYVNGGLFAEEDIEIPNFTEEIRDILLEKASAGFDWSMISPTIFGAVFESTLNPETRRSGGMHYTSIENIHKVIDPLFLDELKEELNEIKAITVPKTRNTKLSAFQNKIASLKWLDPACGSGNFLTETYISIRRLENDVIKTLKGGQMSFGDVINPIKVSIGQFYGIEINDFAVTVAKTALWIAESQMMKETEDIILMHLDFLPLTTNANIHEGNALRTDWESVVPKTELSYIMGNPPFIGHNVRNDIQKKELKDVFGEIATDKCDYVIAWFYLAAKFITPSIKVAFVATNSVCQGVSVSVLWNELFSMGIHISFAWKPFIWDSEASEKAHVHVVIVGFQKNKPSKAFLMDNSNITECNNINGYLLDAPNICVARQKKPICNVPVIKTGSLPRSSAFTVTSEEKIDFIKDNPISEKWIKPYIGSDEFINNKERFCLWLKNADIAEVRQCPKVMERINQVRLDRLSSPSAQTRKTAEKPMLFAVDAQPNTDYLLIPQVSSERRRYIPIGFMTPNIIASNLVFVVPNAKIYHFGILTSNVHNSWMRTVCGRMKSDYRYGGDVVYNAFPWPTPTEEQKKRIEETAQGILDARALYPNNNLADLYDPLTMPIELQKAHIANDKAVMQAYGFNIKETTEADCVAKLMQLYQEAVSNNR